MPWQEGTLTAEDVAVHVGAAAVDERMVRAVDAARTYAERRRQHSDPFVLWSDPAFHDGGVRYAGLLWRSAAAPAGFASYEPANAADYTEYARAVSHLGAEDPVVA